MPSPNIQAESVSAEQFVSQVKLTPEDTEVICSEQTELLCLLCVKLLHHTHSTALYQLLRFKVLMNLLLPPKVNHVDKSEDALGPVNYKA